MRFEGPKQLINFVLACFLAALLIIFGVYIFSIANNHFTPAQFFIFGIILVLSGVFVTSTQTIKEETRWIMGFLLIATGFYQFGRASGVIRIAWLSYFAGTACFLAAGLILYIARPRENQR